MIEKPMDILNQFPVRKSFRQKKTFREAVCDYAEGLGYSCAVEKGNLRLRNIVIGDPEQAKHLITAHYDTSATMLLPNFITPCNAFFYVLYQILVTALMLLPPVLVGFAVNWITDDPTSTSLAVAIATFVMVVLMLYGPANRHNANDNTSGVVTVLELARQLPAEQRHQVCFVLFDLEEAGLVGSSSYYMAHKPACRKQLVWNLDCVGDGDHISFFPSRRIRKNPELLAVVEGCACQQEEKNVQIFKRFFYPSDQANFPYGIGIAALRKGRLGLYVGKIHTFRDRILDEENVNILCRVLRKAIAPDAEE